MNRPDSSPSRSDRLQDLLAEQSRVLRSRVRRRNAGLAAAMILLVGGVAWWSVPRQQVVQPQHQQQQAVAPPIVPQSDPLQPEQSPPAATDARPFRIARIEGERLKLTTIVRSDEPSRVEYISDLQLFIAMRGQGIDAGLVRINGKTQLAFNDEESRRRFEQGFDSAE